MSDFAAWLVEHGAAVFALVAALRAAYRARTLRDAAAAEAMRRLASAHSASEAREMTALERVAELEERLDEAEGRSRALHRELEDLRRALRSDGR
jgi:hypothetical protein